MVFYSPKWIIVEFLRNRLTDPRERAESTHSENFTATTSQTEFSLTAPTGTVSCITSITVDAVAQTKWEKYYIDFRNEKVIFFTGLTEGQVVVINYKYGSSNWIFWDKPKKKLGATKFPRLDIQIITGSGDRLGNYEAVVKSDIHFQIDVWTKEAQIGQKFTIDSRVYAGEELAEYLAYQVTQAFEDYESDLFPSLYNYIPVGMPKSLPFNVELQSHHKAVECMLTGIKIGRIS